MRTPLLLLFLVFAGLVVFVLWMAGGVQSPRTFEADVRDVRTRAPVDTSTATLDVVVWNIAWAYGWGSEGSGGARPFRHFEGSLEKIGGTLRDAAPDVVLLQEVDFDAHRSHGVNQAERIAELAGLPHVAPVLSWKANWVPFPYWPPTEHFGRVESGGAVLSRWPIESNIVTLLPKPEANPFHYNLFYLFRYFQRVSINRGRGSLTIFNAHLEAFDATNRQRQAELFVEALSNLPSGSLLVGGDFNTVPPEASHRAGFSDEPETSFEEDRTLATLRSVDGLRDAFEPDAYAADEAQFFTFPAHEPNRKLDHLLVSEDFEVLEAKVLHEAGDVSDHLPLWVRLRPR